MASCRARACAARPTALPFADEAFDVVAAFDVVEHCEDDALAVSELARVLAPGGRMLLSVPAYQWAWSDHDVRAGHHRRYTRPRLERVVEGAGLTVDRSTYAFGAVFPLFVAERARRRLQVRAARTAASRLPSVSPRTDKVLMGLSGARPPAAPEARPAVRLVDLPRSRQALGAPLPRRRSPQRSGGARAGVAAPTRRRGRTRRPCAARQASPRPATAARTRTSRVRFPT